MRHQTYTHTGLPHFWDLDSLSLQKNKHRQVDIRIMWDNNEEFLNVGLKIWNLGKTKLENQEKKKRDSRAKHPRSEVVLKIVKNSLKSPERKTWIYWERVGRDFKKPCITHSKLPQKSGKQNAKPTTPGLSVRKRAAWKWLPNGDHSKANSKSSGFSVLPTERTKATTTESKTRKRDVTGLKNGFCVTECSCSYCINPVCRSRVWRPATGADEEVWTAEERQGQQGRRSPQLNAHGGQEQRMARTAAVTRRRDSQQASVHNRTDKTRREWRSGRPTQPTA